MILQPTSKVNIKKLQKVKYGSELLINTKKELQLAENRLLELLKKVCFHVWYSQVAQCRKIFMTYKDDINILEL